MVSVTRGHPRSRWDFTFATAISSEPTTSKTLPSSAASTPTGLAETVRLYNEHARRGEDPEFGRGSTLYNRKQGDPQHEGPNPCVAPIEQSPFYAVKVLPGSFGTFAGLKTNGEAQVLDRGGRPIAGLYAVGTDMASVMGGCYPSGGINLGPAMTFGYIAGRHAAGLSEDRAPSRHCNNRVPQNAHQE